MTSTKYRHLSSCTCYNMRSASRLVTQLYDHALNPAGIKITQFTILAALANTGDITVNRLSSLLGMDRTTLSRSLERLKIERLVISRDGDDARERVVKLTDRGFTLLDSAIPYWQKAQNIMEKGFDTMFTEFLAMLKTSGAVAAEKL